MTTWKIDIYDNKDDTTPTRSELIEADTEAEAAEALVKRLRDGEQRGDATPKDDRFKFGDKLSDNKKLG